MNPNILLIYSHINMTKIFGTMLWNDRECFCGRGLVWRLWSHHLAFDGIKTSGSSAAIDVGTCQRFLTDYLFDGGLEQITMSFGRRSEGQIRQKDFPWQIIKSWNRNLMDNRQGETPAVTGRNLEPGLGWYGANGRLHRRFGTWCRTCLAELIPAALAIVPF